MHGGLRGRAGSTIADRRDAGKGKSNGEQKRSPETMIRAAV